MFKKSFQLFKYKHENFRALFSALWYPNSFYTKIRAVTEANFSSFRNGIPLQPRLKSNNLKLKHRSSVLMSWAPLHHFLVSIETIALSRRLDSLCRRRCAKAQVELYRIIWVFMYPRALLFISYLLKDALFLNKVPNYPSNCLVYDRWSPRASIFIQKLTAYFIASQIFIYLTIFLLTISK